LERSDDLAALIPLLVDLSRKVAGGKYGHVDDLMELTKPDKYPPAIGELAESFGMMLVQIEAREFHLEQIIDELAAKNKELEATIAKVRLLENIKNQLSKFVPRQVTNLIENNPENPDLEKRDEDVSVLFLDAAGYTRMSEQVAQEKVNYLIETYFSSFLDVILENEGDINETAGDGLMIIFRNENPRVHAANAVRAAIGIRHRTSMINEAHRSLFEPVTVNMGINSGQASVGSTRFEGITGARWTFTASGRVTNLAARISGLATDGAILAGHETYRRVRQAFRLDPAGRHQLKNIRHSVLVYRVV
jgi:class 3 adenylate cyclase